LKFRKIFVPGGHGFLGSRVVKKLEERGLNFVSFSLRDGIDFRNFEQTKRLFERERFDAVVNCAAFIGGIQFGYDKPGEIFYNNILMSTYLMEASRLTGVKRFVNPISNCTYPAHLRQFREEEWWSGPLHESVLVYGLVRKASWIQSWAYRKQYGFETVTLIFSNMYGPGDHFDEVRSHALGALVKKFVEAKRKKLPAVTVWGTGKPIREWLFIDDGAEAIIRALEMEHTSIEPINVGMGEGISILELAKLIKEIVGYEGKIILDTSKPNGAPCKVMNVTQMKRIFNWTPKTNLRNGIQKTVRWYIKNFGSDQ